MLAAGRSISDEDLKPFGVDVGLKASSARFTAMSLNKLSEVEGFRAQARHLYIIIMYITWLLLLLFVLAFLLLYIFNLAI